MVSGVKAPPKEVASPTARARRKRWAQLISRVFEVDPLSCQNCGAQMRIVAFIKRSQKKVIHKILAQIGEDEALVLFYRTAKMDADCSG